MILEIIVMGSIGVLCIVLGLIIWKKQKIPLVHGCYHRHVKKQDVAAYRYIHANREQNNPFE